MMDEHAKNITDDNGTILETGMLVEISDAYYPEQDGLWLVAHTPEDLDLVALASARSEEDDACSFVLIRKLSDTNGHVSQVSDILPGLPMSRPAVNSEEAARYDEHTAKRTRIVVSEIPDTMNKSIALHFAEEAEKYDKYAEIGVSGAEQQRDAYMSIAKQNGYTRERFVMEFDGLVFVMTCSACPEQYDVFQKQDGKAGGDETVGYVRLRYGHLSCDYPDVRGEAVYEYDFDDEWKGDMDDDERAEQLQKCADAINAKLDEERYEDW